MAEKSDTLIRFLLPDAQTRGALICGRHIRESACRIHGLAAEGEHSPGMLFGQALIASILLLSISKGGVRQVLQLDGHQAPIRRVLAETRMHAVRGYVDWRDEISMQGEHASPLGWLGSPVTLSTVRDLGFGQPYVSNILSESPYLADALVEYLNRSVQVRADIVLRRDTGLLIEAMPGCDDARWFAAVEALAAIPDASFDDDATVLKGFASLGMKIVGRDAYRWRCDCNVASMAQALTGMDAEDLRELQDEAGYITLSCRYCGRAHRMKPEST